MPKPLRWLVAAGATTFAYALYEPYRYHLNVIDVPVRAPGPNLDVLHISDTHLTPRDRKLQEFLRRLPEQLGKTPDLVLSTGDMIEGNEAIDPLVDAVDGIEGRLGRFYVLGSHDYYVSSGPSYTKYFSREKTMHKAKRTDSARFERRLCDNGWIPLTNRTETVTDNGRTIRLSGVDDPYLNRHRTGHIRREAADSLAIALVHAPDVVSEWALNDFDLVVAGHTHGGQVQVPAIGPVVTNCTLPARLGSGLHRVGSTWLHVSFGLGTGRYAPIRFLARPEVTLLRLGAG